MSTSSPSLMSTSTATGFTDETHQLFLSGRDEPGWLRDHRLAAWKAFGQLEWPTRKEEEWIRTDIRLFKPDKYAVTSPTDVSHTVDPLLSQGVELGGQSTTVDGICTSTQLADDYRSQGVVFGSLEQALATHGELIERHLGQAIDAGFDRFSALNSAFWAGGHFLYVPKGVVLDRPFHALSVLSDGATDFGRILVIVDEGAEATFLTELGNSDPEADGLHCGVIEIFVKGQRQAPLCQPAGLGKPNLALRPPKGPRRARRLHPMDHRSVGLTARQGQPAVSSWSGKVPSRKSTG